jgi:F-type H+-transporting ATPase subunit epsilon
MNRFLFSILTLEGVTYKDTVLSVTLPTRERNITILAQHTPLVALIEPGELLIRKKDDEDEGELYALAVSDGFVEVRRDGSVVVLSDTAQRAEDIDVEEAQRARERAEEALKDKMDMSEVDFSRFQTIINREMARIKVAHNYVERRGLS